MPRSLSDLFGRYSLPNVMGRLGHRIGGMFHHGDNTGIVPPDFNPGPISQTGGLTQTGYTPGDFNISNPYTNPSVGGQTSGGGYGGGMSDPFGGGFLGGMSGGGHSSGGQWGGTLGGGTALDPSQWGGLFNNDAGNSVPYHTQFGGMGESGGIGDRHLLPKWQQLAAQHHMGTGGNGPSYDSSGINPGGMYTGGNLPPQTQHMGTGGNLPAQEHPMQRHFGGDKQPPGGLIR
jgi:hypothetical protein